MSRHPPEPGRRTIIRGGRVATDPRWGSEQLAQVDLLIEDQFIRAVGHGLDASGTHVIDALGCLVLPGFVNAHFHSSELLVRGRYDGLTFDQWGALVYPLLCATRVSPRIVYLRTALAAVELVKHGTTTVTDDVASDVSGQTLEALDAVFRAYSDVGIRSNCSGNVMDRSQEKSWPAAELALPAPVRADIAAQRFPTVDQYCDFSGEAIRRFCGWRDLCRYVVAPVAPQWCSDALIIAAAELATENRLALQTHVLETRPQALVSRDWADGGFVPHLRRLGALTENTTIAHGVWLSDRDMDLIAECGANVAHNPVANLRLGVGVARVRDMLRHGVTVSLGTDGLAIHDSPSMLEAMRTAVLLSRACSDAPDDWLLPADVLAAATTGGATSSLLGGEIGRLAPGYRADVVLLRDPGTTGSGRADIRNRLIFEATQDWIDHVIVNGQTVFERGVVCNVDENRLRTELESYLPEIEAEQLRVERRHRALISLLDDMARHERGLLRRQGRAFYR